ncbi:hypothetical protein M404DRAFT_239040 [Pisolithus tinctorius Marx 270]|uniref:Secreted protein n=1 Tax=Pisolithus tinctorius Marx 270 TaxID=870435 RepID=A0A0C3NLT4_PISTI|nr:hypothetical protein M404DRAFT_239040 [Pisolithus tinctorius Marx 270]
MTRITFETAPLIVMLTLTLSVCDINFTSRRAFCLATRYLRRSTSSLRASHFPSKGGTTTSWLGFFVALDLKGFHGDGARHTNKPSPTSHVSSQKNMFHVTVWFLTIPAEVSLRGWVSTIKGSSSKKVIWPT